MRALLIILATGAWIVAGALPWLSSCLIERVRRGEPVPALRLQLPWLEGPARVWARRELERGAIATLGVQRTSAQRAAHVRPLYAPTWLLLAEQSHRAGDREAARAHLSSALALWPGRERLIWNATVLAAEIGDRDLTLALLTRVLRANGERADAALAIARRFEADAERLVDALVPPDQGSSAAGTATLTRLLAIAARERDRNLAAAVWDGLQPAGRDQPDALALYVDALVASGRIEEGIAAWARFGPEEADAHGLTDPGFEREPLQRGLGWRVGAPPGASWQRDARIRRAGDYSLRLTFHGSENVSFLHAAQMLAVEPGGRYRLHGWWRAEALGPRSGPYLELISRHSESWLQVRTPQRLGSFDWEPFELSFEVPRDVRLVELRLRRDAETQPRPFRGSLWLDELRLAATRLDAS